MAQVKVQPLGSHILVEPAEAEETTASGLVIAPTANKERPQRGKVVRLGTGGVDKNGNDIKFHVKEGDEVLFKKYSPDEVEVGGKAYLVMDQSDVLAVIK